MSEDPELDPNVATYYGQGREAARLETISRLEFLRTQELLGRFLPPPPASILDVGGGPGAYARLLQDQGYAVHLLDPLSLHVAQARAAGVAHAQVGDARRLPFEDGSADGVLLLGPLYHLVVREDRLRALREAARTLRPGGRVLVAGITRFASTLDGLSRAFLTEPAFEQIVERDLSEGVHLNPTGRQGWFTTAYFHRPDELRGELTNAGLVVEAVVAIEGPGWLAGDSWLEDERRRDVLLRAIGRVEAEPSLLGASLHFMAVGARPVRTPV